MTMSPERLRRHLKEVELDRDFELFPPEVTVTRELLGLRGLASEHVLRAPELALLFGFQAHETFNYDFETCEKLEKSGRKVDGPVVTRMGLFICSDLRVGQRPLEIIRQWTRDLHIQVFTSDIPVLFEEPFDLSQRTTARLEAEMKGLGSCLSYDYERLSQLRGKFVKHPPVTKV